MSELWEMRENEAELILSLVLSGQGATDQGEGAQGSAAVWAHSGGTLEAAGGAEAERGAPQSRRGGEEEAAAGGGEGQLI